MTYRQTIYVEGGDSPERIEYPNAAETMGIGPCVAMGILNNRSKIAYLVHESPCEKKGLEIILNQALAEAEDPTDLLVHIAGNIFLSRGDYWTKMTEAEYRQQNNVFQEHAKWLISLLRSKGIVLKNISNHLANKVLDGDYNMLIDTYEMKIETTFQANED
jgi:hypothetical protein